MSASVLVVDDDADHRFLIERALRSAGHEVRAVASGEEALGALAGVDIVLLDYRLPGLGGLETLRAIRRRRGPSVVMVTGMGSEAVVVEAMRAGAVDYVVKDGAYLSALPSVVERAWRVHDLERRTGELQRLALLVTSAPSRDRALAEIVAGAQRLLSSDGCQLFLDGTLVASVGDACGDPGAAGAGAQVRIPVENQGELVLCRLGGPDFDAAEVELAVAFSSFAAIALSQAAQLELERRLVEELQETLKVRRQLVSSVTHELRTPLTSIIGFAATLMQHWGRLGDEEKQELLARVHANGQELKDLIDRLLDFSYIETGRLQPAPGVLDLQAEVRAAVDALAPQLADRMVAIDVPALWVRADATLLRRTLWNLLTNAAKYAPDTSAIAVRARVAGEGSAAGDVVVEVVDTGGGMTEDEMGRVFDPFWRSDRVRSRQRGTGLGLALVRDYTRLMGGEVGVRSRLGEGSTFWFTLPTA